MSAAGGSHRKTTVPNRSTSAMPATNSGSAASRSSPSDEPVSNQRSRRTAARIPSPSASGIEMIAEQRTRNAELTSASEITFETGSPEAIDVPGLSVTIPLTQLAYWSVTGRLRCSCSRSAFRLSGVAVRPSSAFAGSLGRACVAAKMITETTASVSAPRKTRRMTKPLIPWKTRRPEARRRRFRPPVALFEGDGAEVVAISAQRQRALARLEPHDLRAVGVDEVVEPPDDVAAAVVLHLLHLMDDGAALLPVDRPERLVVERDELRVVPVRLVVRGDAEAARRDLVQVVARAPVVGGEGVLQILVPVESGRVEVLHVDGDAGLLRLLGKDLGAFHLARAAVRRIEVDGQVRLPRGLQQRLRLLDVLFPLGERRVVAGVERRVDVVADVAVAREGELDHLLAVGDQPERLADPHVVERCLIDGHADRNPAAALAVEDLEASRLRRCDLGERHRGDRVDLATEECVDARDVVVDVDDEHTIEVGLAVLPVIGVAGELGAVAGREADERVRPRPDLLAALLRVLVADRDDAHEVLAEGVRQHRIRLIKSDPDGPLVDLAHVLRPEAGELRRRVEAQLLVEHALDRPGNIVGRHRLAVVELDALAEADRPRLRVLARERGREARPEPVVVVVVDERLEQRCEPPRVGVEDRALSVDDLLVRSSLYADPERAAPLQRLRLDRGRGVCGRQVAQRTQADPAGDAAPH